MQGRVPGGFRSLNYVEIVRDHVSQSLAWRTNRIGCHCSAKRQNEARRCQPSAHHFIVERSRYALDLSFWISFRDHQIKDF